MLAGEPSVVEAFSHLGLTATHVATTRTGLREAWILRKALLGHRTDVLIVDRPRDLRLGALASVFHPMVIINRYNLSRQNPPPDLVSWLAYSRVSMTVFLSRTTAERVLPLAPYIRSKPHKIIPGAVETQIFRPAPAEAEAFRAAHGLGSRPFLLAVGSLTADKRYDYHLDMLAALGNSAPPLLICGNGPLAGKLSSRVRELGLDVRFLGLLPQRELPGAYTAATCFVHACAIETFGLSVLEAMACGGAVVAVRGGAVPEVLGDAGLLAPVNDPRAYGALITSMLGDDTLRMEFGQAARRRATQTFSLMHMQKSYGETVESLFLDHGYPDGRGSSVPGSPV
jgi:glycosyltransferase involved in cell wall biosynthesis